MLYKKKKKMHNYVGGALTSDFVLNFEQQAPYETRALVEYNQATSSQALQLTFWFFICLGRGTSAGAFPHPPQEKKRNELGEGSRKKNNTWGTQGGGII